MGGTTGQSTGRFGFGPQPGPAFGARYGIRLGGPLSLEGVFRYSPTTRDVVDPDREEGDRVVGEADVELLSADARLVLSVTGDRTWHGLNPVVFGGIGVIWDMAGESRSDELILSDDRFEFGSRFLGVFGTGIRWIVSQRVLVRADLSVNMFQLKTPRGYRDPERDLQGVGEKQWVSGPAFSVGLAYHF